MFFYKKQLKIAFPIVYLLGFGISGISAGLANAVITKGQYIGEARNALIKKGWQPQKIENEQLSSDDEEQNGGDVLTMRNAGFIETESCTGVGLNYCRFNYRRNGDCLQLMTRGEYSVQYKSPIVHSWNEYKCSTHLLTK